MRSTDSRRARNSVSVIVWRRLPESLPSRLRCFLASSLVEPLTLCGSLLGSFGARGVRTFTTTFGRSEDSSIGSPALRRDLLLR